MARYKEYGYDIKDGVGIIPEWEMEIKEEAFKGCMELKRIDCHQWVTKIGKSAFSCCENLKALTFLRYFLKSDAVLQALKFAKWLFLFLFFRTFGRM